MKSIKKYLPVVIGALSLIGLACLHFWFEDKRHDCESRGGVLIRAGGYGWQCLSVDALK